MIKIEGECLKDTVEREASNFLGLECSIPEGKITETYQCGRGTCPMTCIVIAKVEYGAIKEVKKVYSGGNCVVNS